MIANTPNCQEFSNEGDFAWVGALSYTCLREGSSANNYSWRLYWTPLKIHLFREKGFSISFTT